MLENKNIFKDLLLALYNHIHNRLALEKASYYDKKLGIEAGANLYFENSSSVYEGRFGYWPIFYGRLERMRDYLKIRKGDVFVDLGCGKGRVVFFIALQSLKKVIGVEIDKGLIDMARINLKNLKLRNSPIEFIHIDARDFDYNEGTIFFMFNPFSLQTLKKVVYKIQESTTRNPRKIRIVYYCPEHGKFLDRQSWLIREGEIENKDCLVWRNK